MPSAAHRLVGPRHALTPGPITSAIAASAVVAGSAYPPGSSLPITKSYASPSRALGITSPGTAGGAPSPDPTWGGAQLVANTGVAPKFYQIFNQQAATWTGASSFEQPWWSVTGGYYNGALLWLQADQLHRQLVITIDMIPTSETYVAGGTYAQNPWIANVIAGNYDAHYTNFGNNLVSWGAQNSVIRIAPEMNGNWEISGLPSDSAHWTDWASAWAHVVTVLRACSGSNFIFDWCVNANYQNFLFGTVGAGGFYPGDAYVDIIGIDCYDASGAGGIISTPNSTRFAELIAQADGVTALLAFAATRSKPVSFPEWGCCDIATGGTNAGGDDAAYITGMGGVIASNPIAYHAYFDVNDDGVLPLTQTAAPVTGFASPLSCAAFGAAFGGAVTLSAAISPHAVVAANATGGKTFITAAITCSAALAATATGGGATRNPVQQADDGGTTCASGTAYGLLTNNIAATNSVVMHIVVHSGSDTVSGITGGGFTTWVKSCAARQGTNYGLETWYGINSSGGTKSITVTMTSGSGYNCQLTEWSGVASHVGTTTGTTGTSTAPSIGQTATAAGQIVVAAVSLANTITGSPGAPWTNWSASDTNWNAASGNGAAWQTSTSAATETATWAQSSGAWECTGVVLV